MMMPPVVAPALSGKAVMEQSLKKLNLENQDAPPPSACETELDIVDIASRDSFPASDPPSWNMGQERKDKAL